MLVRHCRGVHAVPAQQAVIEPGRIAVAAAALATLAQAPSKYCMRFSSASSRYL